MFFNRFLTKADAKFLNIVLIKGMVFIEGFTNMVFIEDSHQRQLIVCIYGINLINKVE